LEPSITRLALLLAAGGAIMVMVGLPDALIGFAGLAAIALGTVLSAPAARGPGGGWWNLLASGAVLSAIGAVIALTSEGVGGLIALIGGAAVLVASTVGFPT